MGHRLERQKDGFRVAAIPRGIERAFSKRRQAIKEFARIYGYKTAKGMELATLRTRGAKREMQLDGLLKSWQAEAQALGFELNHARQQVNQPATRVPDPPHREMGRSNPVPSTPPLSTSGSPAAQQAAAQLGNQLGRTLRTLDQPSRMPGARARLRDRDQELE